MAEYDVKTLARMVGVEPRTIRSYVAEKLLPKPPFRGAKTVYGEEHLIRARAARHLLGNGYLFADARAELANRSLKEIAAMLPAPPAPEPPPAPAPALPPPAPEPAPPASIIGAQLAASPALPEGSGERWERVALLPGLELHVSAGASALVRRVAGEIVAHYVAKA